MFNFGWGEIVLIGIVALIAIGPKELPTVLRTVGQMLGKVRRMANEFQGQFQEALREADIADLKKHAEDVVNDISSFDPTAETRKEIEKSLDFSEPEGAPTSTAADFNPDAPGALAELPAPSGLTDGEKLPEGVLPHIDVPLPDPLPPVTEKDFMPAPAEPVHSAALDAAQTQPHENSPENAPKQAGGKA